MRWFAPLLLCSGCGLVLGLDDYRGGGEGGASGVQASQASGTPTSSVGTGGSAGADVSGTGVGGTTPKMLGEACTNGSECASTFCVDDVCCAQECSAACERCDAGGACVVEAATATCGPYHCDGINPSCPSSCDATSDCAASYFCSVGITNTCDSTNGASFCNQHADCSSGDCNGGVCCNTSGCTGVCRSCNSSHTGFANGYCGLIDVGDPEGDCGALCTGCVCQSGQCVAPS